MERGEATASAANSALTRPEPGLRCVLAPNPSPMTYTGTNTYLLGEGDVVVIDPGPAMEAHLEAILSALGPGERITAILLTHSHLDHSPLARPLASRFAAPVLAAGPSQWGRSATMEALAQSGQLGGGEGIDPDFTPDRQIADTDQVSSPWGEIEVIATPGHMANHLSFAWRDMLFSGDMVMGWSTSLVSPPDGDMGAFMASMERLSTRTERVFYPGHGNAILEPIQRVAELTRHRRAREAQITAALNTVADADAAELAHRIYRDLDPRLLPAAERNVLAHLIDLYERKLIRCVGDITAMARFSVG